MIKMTDVFQPWTLQGPIEEDGTWVVRIAELPGFLVAAESKEELFEDFLPSLCAFLESFPAAGEPVPRAQGRVGWKLFLKPGGPEPKVNDLTLSAPTFQLC